MQRREMLLGALALGLGAGARAQAAKPLVGVLVATGLAPLDGLRRGLQAQGLVEDRDYAIAFRSADGNPRDLPRLARHLAELEPKVLFCAGPGAVYGAVHATSRVPIVALDLETDPLRSALVRSVQKPRTNVTGIFLDQGRITARWFELLRQALPQARQLNLFWEASAGPWQLGAAKNAARRFGFDTDTLVVRDERDFDAELAESLQRKPDAMMLLSSPLVRARSAQLAEFCTAHRLPAIAPFLEFPRAGGLMSYGPDVQDYYLRAATYVDKILKGARPGDLALSLPDNFRLVVNERAAEAIGVTLPPALIGAAQEVIR
ncbi:MAG: ABC transporter substrate-binding protein [Burkholderiales bacterium]|nr:ABC transporter substrate-binding protein [Burkholderiales bacterium]